MNQKYVKPYKNKQVIAGVPHLEDPNRLFYFYGKCIDVTDKSILLEHNDVRREISLQNLKRISLNNGKGGE